MVHLKFIMSYNLLKSFILVICLGYIGENRLLAQEIEEVRSTEHLIEEYDTALSVIRATMTPILSGEMGRGMDYLYSFNLSVRRPGSYHFPTIWIEGQSYRLVLGNLRGEQPIHEPEDELTLNIMVLPYLQPEQSEPLPKGIEHKEAIGIIKAIDGEDNFYIPIFSITPLPKVIAE